MRSSDVSSVGFRRWNFLGVKSLFATAIAAGFVLTGVAPAAEPAPQPAPAAKPAAGAPPVARPGMRTPAAPHPAHAFGVAATRPAVAQTQPTGPAPKIHCEKPIHEFADAWAGEKVEHTFIIRNDGAATLKIPPGGVKPSCGCTLAGKFDDTIEPGKEGKIPVSLSTAKQNAQLIKTIHVQSNDPIAPDLTLTLKGNVKMRIGMEPVIGAAWGRVGPQSPASMTIKLTNNTPKPMKLQAIPLAEAEQKMFEFALKETEPGKAAEVVVTLKKPVREGQNTAILRIQTGITEEPEVTISCNAFMPPLVELMPTNIMAMMTPGKESNQNVSIAYNGEGEMAIKEVKPSVSTIRTQLATATPGKKYNLMVTLPAGFETPNDKPASLVIDTDLKSNPQINIPIRVRIPATQPVVVVAESLIGKPAPMGALKSTEGKDVTFGAPGKEVLVLDFWATWCGYCKKQMPVLDKVRASYDGKPVRFLNVSVDAQKSPQEVVDVAKGLGVSLPIALDPTSVVANKYSSPMRLPTLFLIGKNGIVEAVHRGNTPTLDADVRKALDTLLEGKSLPRPPAQPPIAQNPATQPALAMRPPTTPTTPQAAVPASPGPSLGVDLRQDIGQRKLKEAIHYDMVLRNDGLQPLEVKSIKPSDGLTISDYTHVVQPRSSGSVRCEMTAPDKPGSFSKSMVIESNDPTRATQMITLAGAVRHFVEVQPAIGIDFPRNPRTQNIPSLATLVYSGEGNIEYFKPESSSPRFEAKIDPIPNGPYAKLIVTAKPPFEVGDNTAVLNIKSTCKEQPMLQVPVRLYYPPRIEVSPAEVTVNASSRLQRSVVSIRNNGEKSLSILGVIPSSDQIRWQFYPDGDGMSYKLTLIIPPASEKDASKANASEKVTIRTDDPEFKEIVIPIKVSTAKAEPSDKVSRAN